MPNIYLQSLLYCCIVNYIDIKNHKTMGGTMEHEIRELIDIIDDFHPSKIKSVRELSLPRISRAFEKWLEENKDNKDQLNQARWLVNIDKHWDI
jgi:hypothetical protein